MPVYEKEKTDEDQFDDIIDNSIDKAEQKAMEARAYDGLDLDAEEASGDLPLPSNADKKELGSLPGDSGGGFFNADKDEPGGGWLKNLVSKVGKKRAGIGAALTGLVVALVLAVLSFLPMKILHVVNNLQQTFFASSEEATEKMTDRLFAAYLVKKVMPGMAGNGICTSTRVSKDCVQVTNGDGPLAALYNGWRDARVEEKMATKHGIEIRREGKKFLLVTPQIKEGFELGTIDSSTTELNGNLYKVMDGRADVRRAFRAAVEGETLSKRMMYRFTYGRLIERKHGIARCLIACTTRDKARDNIDAKKAAFKSLFIQRVIMPRSELIGIAMGCAIGGFKCTAEGDVNAYGEKPSEFETKVQNKLKEMRDAGRDKDLKQIHDDAERFRNEGTTSVVLKRILGDTAGQLFGKAIPWVGWINLAAQANKGLREAGGAARQINYVINAAAMVSTYSMYRSTADEMKTGEIDAYAHGSTIQSLSGADGEERADQGGLPAEASPLYGAMFGSEQEVSMFGTRAYAANSYTCDDGSKLPEGELVCPEETLINQRALAEGADLVSDIANSPVFKGSGVAADVWLATIGKIMKYVEAAAEFVLEPVIKALLPDGLEKKLAELASAFGEWFISWFINNPISDNPSGARMFNLAAGGADVGGNDLAHYGLGAKKASDQTIQALRQQRYQDRLEEFKSSSLYARLFSSSSEFSMVSRLAMATPSSVSDMSQSSVLAAFNPSFLVSQVVTSSRVSAETLNHDPFGVTQYAYDSNDPVFTDDPEEYWERNNCADPETMKQWGEKSTLNENTGMQEHDVSNGCKLLRRTIAAAGGIFTDAVLEPEDLGLTSGGTGQFKAMSYNVLGADKDGVPWSTRKQYVFNVIKEKSPDIVGLQEMNEDVQFKDFAAGLPDYDMWDGGDKNERPVIWKRALYDKTDGGIYKYQRYSDSEKQPGTWVKLKNKTTGSELFVFSYHGIANDENADKKVEGAEDLMEEVNDIAGSSAPVVIAGDFNSDYGKFAHPIILAAGFVDTFQVAETKVNADYETHHDDPPAPREKGTKHIDHIFIRPSMPVETWENVIDENTTNGSDHTPIIATIGSKDSEAGDSSGVETGNSSVGNISLKSWKVNLPSSGGWGTKYGSGKGCSEEIKQPSLDAYIAAGGSQWFKKTAGGLDFYVNTGITSCTTGGSTNPRSELREMNASGSNEYNWNPSSGTHRMIIRQKVSELAVKGDGAGVVIGQIHDVDGDIDDYTVFRLEGKTLYAFVDGKKSSSKVIDSNFPLNQIVTLGFSVENGVVKFLYDKSGGAQPPVVHSVKYPSGSEGAYFKAGNYCQCGGSGRSGSTRVIITGLGIKHDGSWPGI